MNKGWLLLFLSIGTYGTWGFLAKLSQQKGASSPLLTALTAAGSALVALFICLPQIDFSLVKMDKACVIPGIGAGIAVGLANIVLYKAIQTVPAAIAYPVSSLWILVTVALSLFFLKEQINISQGIGIIFAVIAVFLLSR